MTRVGRSLTKISNISGEQLEQFEMYLSGGINNIPIELNSSNYPSGVYLIEIQAGINKYFTKIVKM